MRVALIDSICDRRHPGTGGLSDIVWRMAAELVTLGASPTVVGPYDARRAPERTGVTFHPAPAVTGFRENIASIMLERFALAAAARRAGCNTFYAVDSLMAAALTVGGLGSRTVWHGHNNVLYHSQVSRPWDRWMYHAMLWSSYLAGPRVGRVAILGRSLERWWTVFGVPADRIIIVPNGIDLPPDSRNHVYAEERHNAVATRLLYIGRLTPEKGGVDELILATGALNRSDARVTLTVVGDGPHRPSLEQLAHRVTSPGVVTFTGSVPHPEVPDLYRRADLVVLPSRGEMMPRVMLEAWAAGIPFMATPVGAIPDYLEDNINGFLVTTPSADALEARLREVLSQPELLLSVGRQSRESARCLTWRRAAEALLHDGLQPLDV